MAGAVGIEPSPEADRRLCGFSQFVLGIAPPFAVVPLVMFTSSKEKMGTFVNSFWIKFLSYFVAALLIGLNVWLIYSQFVG